MEEFRPFLADRLALSLINRRQVALSGFKITETGSVVMTDETRKAVLVAYQDRKQGSIATSCPRRENNNRFTDPSAGTIIGKADCAEISMNIPRSSGAEVQAGSKCTC